ALTSTDSPLRDRAADSPVTAASLPAVRSDHRAGLTARVLTGPRQSTTRRDRICHRGEIGGRAPGDAPGPTWEHHAPTAGTIASAFSPARSGRVQWRRGSGPPTQSPYECFAASAIAPLAAAVVPGAPW